MIKTPWRLKFHIDGPKIKMFYHIKLSWMYIQNTIQRYWYVRV